MRRVLLLFLFVTASSSQAGSFYVDPVSGNNANDGSIGAPWRTIQRAVKSPFPFTYRSPGDIVYLRGGFYRGNTNGIDINAAANSGTSNAPITITAYPGETPIVCDQTSPYRGVIIANLSWWVFDGITYSNCYQSVWMESCTNFVWKNCTFGWRSANSIYAGFNFWGDSQLNTVSNCTFTRWGAVSSGCNDEGVSISIGDETGDSPMWYNLIVSNRFIYGGHDHFQLNTAYNVIRGNLFVNAPWIPTNAECNTLASPAEANMYGAYGNRHTKPGDAGTSQIDMRNVWECNTFLYTGPPPDDNGAFGIELGTRRSIYRFNTIAFSLAAGIYFNTSGSGTLSSSNAVYGNVLYGNGLSMEFGGEGMQDFAYGLSMSTFEDRRTNNFIVNNIIWRNLPGNIWPNTLLYQQFRQNFTNDMVDPLFMSTNGWGWSYEPTNLPDFRLRAGSPCIDAGTWLAYITSSSGSGTSFTVDNSLYFSDGNRIVQGDTIQLQGQAVTAVVSSNDYANNVLYFSPALTWTNGQGVSLAYSGTAPDIGAYERPIEIWYVSPTGTGDGTLGSPGGLSNAITPANWATNISAGDTVYLRGGTYAQGTNFWTVGFDGTNNDLVTWRAYTGEYPKVDGPWRFGGNKHHRFWGIEFYDSHKNDWEGLTNPWLHFDDAGAVGGSNEWVNCIIHDVHNCFSGTSGGHSIRGCILWYVGQTLAEHAVYPYSKEVRGNIGAWTSGEFIETGVDGMILRSNILFGEGWTISNESGNEIVIGFPYNATVEHNSIYDQVYWTAGLRVNTADSTIVSNVIAGPYLPFMEGPAWGLITYPNNTVCSYEFYNTNTLDLVRVFKNDDEAKRAHIAVFNWASNDVVAVSLSGVLVAGDTYQLISAQNYAAGAIQTGTYNGTSISVPMTNLTVAPVLYGTNTAGKVTSPQFAAFVVLGAAGGGGDGAIALPLK